MLGSSPFQAFRTEADDGGHRLNLHSCMCRVKDYTNSIIVSLTDPALNLGVIQSYGTVVVLVSI